MKVFVSSVIVGMEDYRDAARAAVMVLRHEVIRAEDFGALPETPRQACLAGVRRANVVILLLGERYGTVQPSGLSATHEEYREARERCPVLVFVQEVGNREPRQEAFLREVQGWASGHLAGRFGAAEELRDKVIQTLHEFELARTLGPVDEVEMLDRARELVPTSRGFGSDTLSVIVAGGPRQQVLRPAALEDERLHDEIQREASFGEVRVLDPRYGTETRLDGDALLLEQEHASVLLNEEGTIRVLQPARVEKDYTTMHFPVLIEEDVQTAVQRAIRFSSWLLDRIDPLRRLSDTVPVAALVGGTFMAWRTRAEHSASPHTVGIGRRDEVVVVSLSPARRQRSSLSFESAQFSEDLTIRLRRAVRG